MKHRQIQRQIWERIDTKDERIGGSRWIHRKPEASVQIKTKNTELRPAYLTQSKRKQRILDLATGKIEAADINVDEDDPLKMN